MSQALVDDLKAAFPNFNLKNKLNVPKSLFLADGEEIVVPPNGTVRVAATSINSFPDFSVFEYISPKLEDLEFYGMIERTVLSPTSPSIDTDTNLSTNLGSDNNTGQ